MDLISGVVLDIGHGVVTCAGVWDGKEQPNPVSCLPKEASPPKLAEMVHTISMSSSEEEMQEVLAKNVVVTGNRNRPPAHAVLSVQCYTD